MTGVAGPFARRTLLDILRSYHPLSPDVPIDGEAVNTPILSPSPSTNQKGAAVLVILLSAVSSPFRAVHNKLPTNII